MGYIGATPSNAFINNDVQRVTNSTNNYVDLDHNISSLDSVIVFVNNVRQESTNLTFTSASRIGLGDTLQNSDVVEIVFIGKAVATQSAAANSITNSMLAGSIANSKLANSSITLNGSAVSLGGSATVGGTNDNLFRAYRNGNQTINHGVVTKVELNAESFDVDSKFDSSTNYRYTPSSTGYYYLSATVNFTPNDTQYDRLRRGYLHIYKNGSTLVRSNLKYLDGADPIIRDLTLTINTIDNSTSASDYYEVYAEANNPNGSNNCAINGGTASTFFTGYKLIT